MEKSRNGLYPWEVEKVYPVVAVKVHRNGHLTVIRKSKIKPQNNPWQDHKRGKISKLTNRSVRRLMHIGNTTNIQFNSLVTLTYGKYHPSTGLMVKEDFSVMRKWFKKHCENYLWFLEFQVRGAPHLHILLDTDCITPAMRLDLMYRWVSLQISREYFYGQCPIGHNQAEIMKLATFNLRPQVWELIKKRDGAARYLSQYASKKEQKKVPEQFKDVGRFWGCSRKVSKIDGMRVELGVDEVLKFLRDEEHPAADYEYLPKFVWRNQADGT